MVKTTTKAAVPAKPKKPTKPTDINSFKKACLIIPPTSDQKYLLDYKGKDQHMIAAQTYLMLTIIFEAINYLANDNQTWYPDWSNSNEWKYYPWMKYKSGSGFSYRGYDDDYSDSAVGSRLCTKSSSLAMFIGETFTPLYNKLFIIKKVK